jgi:hypothetical protein
MRIPEGLHKTGPTFCIMMMTTLKEQVGRNVFSYVDDIIVTSKKKIAYNSTGQKHSQICMSPG